MHKRNVKFNALQHGRQFVNERLLLLQRLRAWPVQLDVDCSETAETGTCSDDLKCGRLVGDVDRRQRDIGTGNNGNAAVDDRQVVSCTRLPTIDKWRRISDREQRSQHRARFPLDRADQWRGDDR